MSDFKPGDLNLNKFIFASNKGGTVFKTCFGYCELKKRKFFKFGTMGNFSPKAVKNFSSIIGQTTAPIFNPENSQGFRFSRSLRK